MKQLANALRSGLKVSQGLFWMRNRVAYVADVWQSLGVRSSGVSPSKGSVFAVVSKLAVVAAAAMPTRPRRKQLAMSFMVN